MIEVWRRGAWGEICVVMEPPSEPLAVIEGLKRSAPSVYRQVLGRFDRLAQSGPRWHDWFKKLEDAEDLCQLRYEQHRFLLFPHPRSTNSLVLLVYFKKQQHRTPPAQIQKALVLRERCISSLSRKAR